MRFRHFIVLVFGVLLLPNSGLVHAQILSGNNPALPQIHANALAWADYDSDGKPDLLMMGLDSAGLAKTFLLRNTGSSFVAVSHPFPVVTEGAAAWADIDNDGDPDLILAGRLGAVGLTSLWLNNAGVFVRQSVVLPQLRVPAIACADLDADGDQDCFLSGLDFFRGQVMVVMENVGGSLVERLNSGLEGEELVQAKVEIAQVSGGSLPEIIVQGFDTAGVARTQFWHNDGSFSFSLDNINVPGMYSGSVSSADANGDGQNDLLFCGKSPRYDVQLCLGDSLGPLMNANPVGLPPLSPGLMEWMDFNGDGLQDVIVAGDIDGGTICKAMRAQPGLVYVDNQVGNPMIGLHNPVLAIADWNGDGYLDLAISGQDANWFPVSILYHWDNLLQRFVL